MSSLKLRSLKSLAWSLTENLGVAVLSLVSFVVLARLLDPADFGVVALASVFVVCFNLLIGSALADGIIQRPELGERDLDTAFWGTLGLGTILALGCLLGAEPAARALREPGLAQVLPWLAPVPVLGALGAVPIALQRRGLRFRGPALSSLLGRVCGAILAVVLAWRGYGLWSLVAQQVAGAAIANLGAWATARWWPRARLSWPVLRQLWGFGAHVSGSQIVSAAGEQAVVLLVGTFFGATLLGHFTVAWRMVQLVKSLVIGTVYHVAFSAFARLQHDRPAIARTFLEATQLSCLIGFPLGIGMAAVAAPAIVALFGERWSDSIPLFAILALEMVPAFHVLFVASCLRALGRPGWALGLALAHSALAIGGTLAVASLGLEAVAAVWVAKSFLVLPVTLGLTHRLLGMPVTALLAPALGPLLASLAMAASVLLLLPQLSGLSASLQLAIAVAAGVAAYGLVAPLVAGRSVRSVLRTLRSLRQGPVAKAAE